jgi:hypothetical protein
MVCFSLLTCLVILALVAPLEPSATEPLRELARIRTLVTGIESEPWSLLFLGVLLIGVSCAVRRVMQYKPPQPAERPRAVASADAVQTPSV